LTRDPPFYVSDLREGSNTAEDFLAFVLHLIMIGVLVAGDVFVVDNASVHYAMEIRDRLIQALEQAHVRLLFLPTYSPELNPVELVFGQSKGYLYHRRGGRSLRDEIVSSLCGISWENVLAYYEKCILI
jgi:transposase